MIVQREGKKRSTGIANIYRACRMSHRVRLYVGVEIERQTELERERESEAQRDLQSYTTIDGVYAPLSFRDTATDDDAAVQRYPPDNYHPIQCPIPGQPNVPLQPSSC